MSDLILHCNINECRAPLTDVAWVTRCWHVFCLAHGQSHFSAANPHVNCPVCNEINAKEVDVMLCDVHPPDMVLAGLSPEKTLSLVSKSLKLWSSQIVEEFKFCSSRIEHYKVAKRMCASHVEKLQKQHFTEMSGLKKCYEESVDQLKTVKNELERTKIHLKKYKMVLNKNKPGYGNRINEMFSTQTPEWFKLPSFVDDITGSNIPGPSFLAVTPSSIIS